MSVAHLVVYEGYPEDREEFLRYYIGSHIPIIWTWPLIRDIEIDLAEEGSELFMIARFSFDNAEDLEAAMDSEERRRAREDRDNLPAFHGSVSHHAVTVECPPRP